LTQRKAFYKDANYPFDVEKLKYKWYNTLWEY
jgi:hypothetical protein